MLEAAAAVLTGGKELTPKRLCDIFVRVVRAMKGVRMDAWAGVLALALRPMRRARAVRTCGCRLNGLGFLVRVLRSVTAARAALDGWCTCSPWAWSIGSVGPGSAADVFWRLASRLGRARSTRTPSLVPDPCKIRQRAQ